MLIQFKSLEFFEHESNEVFSCFAGLAFVVDRKNLRHYNHSNQNFAYIVYHGLAIVDSLWDEIDDVFNSKDSILERNFDYLHSLDSFWGEVQRWLDN